MANKTIKDNTAKIIDARIDKLKGHKGFIDIWRKYFINELGHGTLDPLIRPPMPVMNGYRGPKAPFPSDWLPDPPEKSGRTNYYIDRAREKWERDKGRKLPPLPPIRPSQRRSKDASKPRTEGIQKEHGLDQGRLAASCGSSDKLANDTYATPSPLPADPAPILKEENTRRRKGINESIMISSM